MNLNNSLNDAMKKYLPHFEELKLEVHTIDCHSESIQITLWDKRTEKLDIFPKVFSYNPLTEIGRWEDPECDLEYETDMLVEMLNEKTQNYDQI